MKNLLLALAILAVGGGGCSTRSSIPEIPVSLKTQLPTATPIATPVASTSPASPVSSESIYQLGAEWKDQDGKSLRLKDLRGNIQVLALVYTSCGGACPRTIQDMKIIERKLGKSEVGFVLVTFDPEVDTPQKLRELAVESKLLGNRWRLLNGKADQVRELAALVGVQYSKTSDGGYDHSNIITVLDSEGVIIHQQNGLGTDPAETLKSIQKSSAKPSN